MGSKTKQLRALIEKPGMILRPGIYDSLTAKLAEKAGFEWVLLTGYGVSGAMLGRPDVGLLSFGEILQKAREVCNMVNIPVVVDVDTGYGNAVNVFRTTQEMIWAGAAAIQIEDQVWPKRCGHMFGKQIISTEEMTGKIRAATDAKNGIDPEVVIGARTDARSVSGFKEVLKRGKAYADAGADYIYVETPKSLEEIEKIVKEIKIPVTFNIIEGGKTPSFNFDDLEKLGVKILSLPLTTLYAATKAVMDVLEIMKNAKKVEEWERLTIPWHEFNELIGLSKIKEMEKKYLPEELLKKMYGEIEK
ncbi:MAG: isocitrate lyase/PEP mutase family protein [Thermoplasmatales archaeon]|nr:isocitrate lyase/PEP mutase family protein [Candidatus Thermoplasmatota archaeon]MCG2825669.1 isocitrate lyase/PEP mutase family protein [Thermoplasmatales archaeon]